MKKNDQPSAAIAVPTAQSLAVPSFIEESTEGREQIDKNDLSLPRLIPVNALSKQFKERTADLGDLVENVSGNVLYTHKAGVPLKGVFIAIRKMRNKWRPKGAGEGIECHSPDGHVALMRNGLFKGQPTNNCLTCEYAQFTKMPDGSIKAPACTEYREFLFLAESYPLPLVLSFGKAAAKEGKKLVEKLNADMGVTNRPIYAFAFDLSSVLKQGGGNEWYQAVAKSAGFPSEELYTQAKALYAGYKDSLKKQDFRAQEPEAGSIPADDPTAPRV